MIQNRTVLFLGVRAVSMFWRNLLSICIFANICLFAEFAIAQAIKAGPESTDLVSPDSTPQITNPLVPGNPSGNAVEIPDAAAVPNSSGQFDSFIRSNPGRGIGADFFGLDDDFDSGLLIRSEKLAMRIGGSLKVDLIQDFNAIGNTDSFDVTTIEIGAAPRRNTRFHARQTRLNFDTRWKTDYGPVRVFIEGDFFFNQRESFQLGADRFRLRQAYAQFGQWKIGQTWTTFSDVAASPATLDFEGNVASLSTRRTQLRWTKNLEPTKWSLALAIEDPFTLIGVPEGLSGQPRTQTPDGVARFRWSRPNYQLQIGSVIRELGYQPTGEDVLTDIAWGLNFTQVMKLTTKTKFYSEILWGSGIGSFRGIPDAVPTGPDSAEIVRSLGWMVGVTHEWTSKLSSNVTYAENRIENQDPFPGNTIKEATYFAINLIHSPVDRIDYGIEYLWGQRGNFDGRSGIANRIQAAVIVYLR